VKLQLVWGPFKPPIVNPRQQGSEGAQICTSLPFVGRLLLAQRSFHVVFETLRCRVIIHYGTRLQCGATFAGVLFCIKNVLFKQLQHGRWKL
tara:strand:- start:540 stop:815 length:276 start_codon:yes stop_codon:yes gene_type:complete